MSVNTLLRFVHFKKEARTSNTLRFIGLAVAGTLLGNFFAKLTLEEYAMLEFRQWSDEHIVRFESYDQLNSFVDRTQKPVVAYFYLATFVFCNLGQSMLHASTGYLSRFRK